MAWVKTHIRKGELVLGHHRNQSKKSSFKGGKSGCLLVLIALTILLVAACNEQQPSNQTSNADTVITRDIIIDEPRHVTDTATIKTTLEDGKPYNEDVPLWNSATDNKVSVGKVRPGDKVIVYSRTSSDFEYIYVKKASDTTVAGLINRDWLQ